MADRDGDWVVMVGAVALDPGVVVTPRYVIRYDPLKLTEARERAGLTQEQLGKRLGVTNIRVAQLEQIGRVHCHEFSEEQFKILNDIGFASK